MEIIISYAFAHIIEAIILWMSMSQMYEHRYKQWVTGTSRYITTKNRKNTTERLELKKYNPILKRVTVHKEIK